MGFGRRLDRDRGRGLTVGLAKGTGGSKNPDRHVSARVAVVFREPTKRVRRPWPKIRWALTVDRGRDGRRGEGSS